MKWRGRRQSDNIEDQRGRGAAVAGVGGIGALVLVLVSAFLGVDLTQIIPVDTTGGEGAPPGEYRETAEERELADFTAVVLADTEDAWTRIFQQEGQTYRPPRLVLFTNSVRSGCGFASSQVGPFYCPLDQKVYIDLGFYRLLRERLGAGGDFAQAYVIAHEVGHHVQNLLGTFERETRDAGASGGSVRAELQADCYAGLWARYARDQNLLDVGDVEEAMRAAEAIGDDALQGGQARPDTFTHGTSAQRMRWFRAGLEGGRIADCDTFYTNRL